MWSDPLRLPLHFNSVSIRNNWLPETSDACTATKPEKAVRGAPDRCRQWRRYVKNIAPQHVTRTLFLSKNMVFLSFCYSPAQFTFMIQSRKLPGRNCKCEKPRLEYDENMHTATHNGSTFFCFHYSCKTCIFGNVKRYNRESSYPQSVCRFCAKNFCTMN